MKGRFLLQYGGKRKLLQTMLLINKQKHAVTSLEHAHNIM